MDMRLPEEHRAAAGILVAATLVVGSGCAALRASTSAPARVSTARLEPTARSPAARPLDPTHPESPAPEITAVVATREGWRFAGYPGQIINTPHYRVYTTLTRHTLIDRLPLFLERALVHYTTALADLAMPSDPLETYLFGTRRQWAAKTRQMLPDQAATFLSLGRGGFTTRGTSVLYYLGRNDTFTIASHEGWHQYSQQTFKQQLPIWLEEGIATYMEGYVSFPDGVPKFRPWANLERYLTLRDAVNDDRLIPLSELLERKPQSFLEGGKNRLLIFYAQLWGLTLFLAEGDGGRYRGGLSTALNDAAQGRLTARLIRARRRGEPAAVDGRLGLWALREYFDPEDASFERRYLEFVRRMTQPGGRNHIVRGRSPLVP